MVVIKIVTGKTGKVGKTLLATALYIYSLRKNRKTAVVDWNLNNPDLLYSLFWFDQEDSQTKNGFFYKEIKVDDTKKKLKVFYPLNPNQLEDSDFWPYLSDLYPHIEGETTCIIDTRVDITRLPNWKNDISKCIKKFKKTKFEIYNIFGWRYLPDEITALENSFKWLEEHIPNIEFIYVWNVYEQSKPRKLFLRPVGWSLYKEYEKRLEINKQKPKQGEKKTSKWRNLTFPTLLDLMRKFSFYRAKGLDPNEIPELWSPLFRNLFEKIENDEYFKNLLLILEKTDLVFSSDVNTIGRKGNIREIQKARKKFYEYIKKFEGMRDRI